MNFGDPSREKIVKMDGKNFFSMPSQLKVTMPILSLIDFGQPNSCRNIASPSPMFIVR
jgi:hypothetical protein